MSPRVVVASVFRQDECELGEGPVWHSNQLWWIDIERGQLRAANSSGDETAKFEFGQRIGSAVPEGADGFLVALEKEVVHLNLKSKKRTSLARPGDIPPRSRFNDGKCDPHGRFVVGTLCMDGSRNTSALYSLRADHSIRHLKQKISLSNGLAWSEDGQTLFHIDTPEKCVFSHAYNLETGEISDGKIALNFSGEDGFPDGMTIDRKGRLWIGFWDGGEVRCYHPVTGTCETIVRLPCDRVTSCCFGGNELDQLFITTARTGLSSEALGKQPLAGSIFTCNPHSVGYPTITYSHENSQKS